MTTSKNQKNNLNVVFVRKYHFFSRVASNVESEYVEAAKKKRLRIKLETGVRVKHARKVPMRWSWRLLNIMYIFWRYFNCLSRVIRVNLMIILRRKKSNAQKKWSLIKIVRKIKIKKIILTKMQQKKILIWKLKMTKFLTRSRPQIWKNIT